MKYNTKKKLQISLRRYYATNNPSKEISEFVNLSKEEFKNYINNKFIDGMNENNFGSLWGLDHLVPVELFDLDNIEELKICYNFLNIIPMFNNDNRLKGCSIHFSIIMLNRMLQKEGNKNNVKIIEKLLFKCEEEKVNRYDKYLL